MKTAEKLAIVVVLILFTMSMFYLGFQTGKGVGRWEQGEWIKVVDTTFYYEFKQKL